MEDLNIYILFFLQFSLQYNWIISKYIWAKENHFRGKLKMKENIVAFISKLQYILIILYLMSNVFKSWQVFNFLFGVIKTAMNHVTRYGKVQNFPAVLNRMPNNNITKFEENQIFKIFITTLLNIELKFY